MLDDNLTLRRMQYFNTVAESGSVRRGAELEHMSQPSMSAHLAELERALGVRLLDRERSGVKVTAPGRLLLERMRAILGQAERLSEYANSLKAGHLGVISIAAYPVHIQRFLAVAMREYLKDHSGIQFDFTKVRDDRRRNVGRSLFDELLDGEVDLAMGPPHLELGLEGVRAYDAHILALFPTDHEHFEQSHAPINSLKEAQVLIAPRGYFSRDRVEAECKESGFRLCVAAESASPMALRALGIAGIGVPVLPDDYSVVGGANGRHPVLVNTRGDEILTPVWLQWRRGNEFPSYLSSFIDVARDVARKDNASPRWASIGADVIG